jgi:UTP:GlnB (protein PII) uridylyltransferase
MRRGPRANALSLQATMPPFLPVWLTGDSYGAVSVCSLLSTPISRRSSLVLRQDAISDALSSTHRYAPREMQRLEDEPDLKRGPGGLRDLRRAVWANTAASAHPISLTQASLVEAHRFLRLVRCHLHFLAGRADDRLSLPLQPGIARRLGLDAPQNSVVPHLLDLFRYHARNVLAAITATPLAKSGIQT